MLEQKQLGKVGRWTCIVAGAGAVVVVGAGAVAGAGGKREQKTCRGWNGVEL